jgi:opacity protein-like surface antigen
MYVGIKAGYTQVGDMDITIPAEEEEEEVIETPTATEIDFPEAGYSGALEHDGGWLLGLAIGNSFNNFRLEGEIEYRSNDFSAKGVSGDETLTTISLMANGYYDFNIDSGITPYVGAGIGMARHDAEVDDDTVFAYQATIGLAMPVSDTMDLDFAYRYFATADPDFGVDLDYDSHNLTVGIRFKM